MVDSDGPIVAKAIYKALNSMIQPQSILISRFEREATEVMRDTPEEDRVATLLRLLTDKGSAIEAAYESFPPPRILSPLSLAYVLDDLVRELRDKGLPPEQWATFVHIGI